MSREGRRTESTATRLALLESDQDRTDVRLKALEETSGANRTAFWSGIATIVVAMLTAAGYVLAVVVR